MKICEIRWKSSEDKKPARKRVKVSIGAAGRHLPASKIHVPKFMKIYKIYDGRWGTLQIYENL